MQTMHHSSRLLVVIVLLGPAHLVQCALPSTACPAPQPCQCDISIHCERRSLTSVPIATHPSSDIFIGFYLSGNEISVINKDSLKNYHASSLDLSHNPISTFEPDAFVGLEKDIQELNLEDTNLHSIPSSVAGLSKLKKLNIQNNPIMQLPSSITAGIGGSLLSFSMGHTNIRYWPTALKSLVKLDKLDMSHNKVSYIRPGGTDAFANSLRELRVVNGSFSTFQAEIGKLTVLQILDLSQNPIQSITKGSFSQFSSTLKEFYLKGGQLTYLPDALEDLTALEELDLSNNPMMSTNEDAIGTGQSSLLTKSASTLTTVILASCQLVAVPRVVVGLTSLIRLDLSHNRIRVLNNYQFDSLSKLVYLSLNDNPLTSIPYHSFSGLTSLKALNLSGCSLTYVPSSSLTSIPSLSSLYLADNRIHMILDYAFPKGSKLAYVDMAGNALQNISENAFAESDSIMTLILSRCSLTGLPHSLTQAHGLRSVYLENNSIKCTCKVFDWVRQWKIFAGIIPHIYGFCSNDRTLTFDSYIEDIATLCAGTPIVG